MMTLQTTCWVIHPHFRKCPWLHKSTCSLSPGRQPKYLPKVARLHHTRSLLLNLKGGFLPQWYDDSWLNGYVPPPPNIWPTMVKREQDTAVNLPFGEGEKRKLSVVAGRTGRARSPCLGQPAWQLLALLDYVQCETLSWSFSTIAAPGWDGHWQSASSWVLLGASGLFVDPTAIGGISWAEYLSVLLPWKLRILVCLLPVNSLGWLWQPVILSRWSLRFWEFPCLRDRSSPPPPPFLPFFRFPHHSSSSWLQ